MTKFTLVIILVVLTGVLVHAMEEESEGEKSQQSDLKGTARMKHSIKKAIVSSKEHLGKLWNRLIASSSSLLQKA